jgi:trans-2,3-dihydro-3-hydroxyanthranilate isomerase
LAVVLDAGGLDKAAMQAIAREFNLSETVFVLPPEQSGHRARLRIFTPAAELAFAGHPTVGTAVLLGCMDGTASSGQLVLEAGIGNISCVFEPRGEGGYARFAVPRLPEQGGAAPERAAIAAALGLAAGDVGTPDFEPEVWSAGNAFTFVPVRGLNVVRRARPDLARWDAAFGGGAVTGAFVLCRETEMRGHDFHARMFAPQVGVFEDPATGSAAAAFAGMIARGMDLADGEHAFTIEQGYEMGRPSLILLTLHLRGGKLSAAAIGGEAVPVSEGTIEA